jgi:plasmid stability protein
LQQHGRGGLAWKSLTWALYAGSGAKRRKLAYDLSLLEHKASRRPRPCFATLINRLLGFQGKLQLPLLLFYGNMVMKTTLELPDELMRALKVRAAQSDRKLRDVVAELLQRGLDIPPEAPEADPLTAWHTKLVFHADGSVTNPDGVDDPEFFASLDHIRNQSRNEPARDPFTDCD